ncbi:MAG: hypothetical protein LBD94_00885, partial [Rickettsiales bacterium]|nr:hypothetical protein [Rickettsiales bacterium]
MKKIISTLLLAAFVSHANAGVLVDLYVGATASFGNSVTYIPSGAGIPSTLKDLRNSAESYGAVLGIDIPVIRIEGEYDYLLSKNVDIQAAMINLYIKLFPTPIVKPYIGAGIGSAFAGRIGGDIDQKVESSKAFQGMLGLQISIPATSLFVDVEGRVFYT